MSDCFGAYKGLVRVALSAFRRCQVCFPQCELMQPIDDIDMEVDVEIPVSEGKLLANIFRSKSKLSKGEKHPVLMCMHPYDNHITAALGKTPLKGCPQQYRLIPQAGNPKFSTQTSWESPDPNFWVKNGYAVVNLNAPGYAGSGGKPGVFDNAQSAAYYEAIEWVAKQPWCTGAVGLNGVSFLAVTQYHVASCRNYGGKAPPSLKCICPWEGLSDPQQVLMSGGVSEIGFPSFWYDTEVKPALTSKNPQDFLDNNGGTPPKDWMGNQPQSFWAEKRVDVHNIVVPMLVCASWSDHGLHTTGSLRAFTEAGGPKWMYTHRTGKWDAYYSEEAQVLTLNFFDRYVKGVNNGWDHTPPVRLEVRSSRDVVHEVRYETAWPLPATQYTRLFLLPNCTLSEAKPSGAELTMMPYGGKGGCLGFKYTFAEPTEWTGHFKLYLEVAVDGSPDMTVFVVVKKFDKQGRFVPFYGSTGLNMDAVTRGCGRASYRELDRAESKEYLPRPSYRKLPVTSGETMDLHIAMEASGTFFDAGESVQLIISSQEIIPTGPYVKSTHDNQGMHMVFTGESYLLVPHIPKK